MDFRFFLRDAKNSMGEVMSKLQQGSEGGRLEGKAQGKMENFEILSLI